MIMIDTHVHVGWFLDGYHSPKEIVEVIRKTEVDEICVSSTSTCAELYKLVIKEMKALKRYLGKRAHPILWLTPRMFRTYGLRFMLRSKIQWEGIKIHPESHPEWFYNSILLNKAVEISRFLSVPMLIHTGNFTISKAENFKNVIKDNQDICFVLAHGRPVNQAINIIRDYSNVYVDTSFMSRTDLMSLSQTISTTQICWGTDLPINHFFYPEISSVSFVNKQLQMIKTVFDKEWLQIVSRNPYHYKGKIACLKKLFQKIHYK